jgi:hypothetical protein
MERLSDAIPKETPVVVRVGRLKGVIGIIAAHRVCKTALPYAVRFASDAIYNYARRELMTPTDLD